VSTDTAMAYMLIRDRKTFERTYGLVTLEQAGMDLSANRGFMAAQPRRRRGA
jgi:hypothetical protein